jgi:hypothetical protein
MDEKLRICISSPPDRERLVAEIFFGSNQLAELNQEDGSLQVELYPRSDGAFWYVGLEEILQALIEAKQRLLGE